MPQHFLNVQLNKTVVMPDHFHLIYNFIKHRVDEQELLLNVKLKSGGVKGNTNVNGDQVVQGTNNF